MLRRAGGEQVQQPPGLENVVLQEGLHRMAVLLAAHVLVGGEIGHDVEAARLLEDADEDRVREVQGVGPVILGDRQSVCAAQVAGQLRQAVLAQVDHDEGGRTEAEQLFDEGGADGTGAADDAGLFACDLRPEAVGVRFQVRCKQALRASSDGLCDEFIEMECHDSGFVSDTVRYRCPRGPPGLPACRQRRLRHLFRLRPDRGR